MRLHLSSLAILPAVHAIDKCWPNHFDDYFQQICCKDAAMRSQCFNGIYTYETCCLGATTPFASWPLRSVIMGYPGCGTTSLSILLSSHPNISLLRRDEQGRAWKGHEMQAVNMLIQQNSHAAVRHFGHELGKELRFSRHLFMSLGLLCLVLCLSHMVHIFEKNRK